MFHRQVFEGRAGGLGQTIAGFCGHYAEVCVSFALSHLATAYHNSFLAAQVADGRVLFASLETTLGLPPTGKTWGALRRRLKLWDNVKTGDTPTETWRGLTYTDVPLHQLTHQGH
eukprot:gene3550-52411_t